MNLNKRLILILSVLVLFSGCAPYLMKAKMANRDKRYELALNYALRHLNNNPQDASARHLVGKIARKYFEVQKSEISRVERLENWEKMIALSEETHSTLNRLSEFAGMNFPGKAELDFLKSKMAFSNQQQAEALYLEARQVFNQARYEQALKLFDQVQKHVSNYKDSEQLISQSKQNLAEQKYQEGLQIFNNKQYPATIEKMKNVLELVPNYKDAAQYIDRANKALAYEAYQKAMTLQKEGKYREALGYFESTQKYVPNFEDTGIQIQRTTNQLVQSLTSQAENQAESGNARQALKTYQEVLEVQPDNTEVQQKYQVLRERLTVRLGVLPFQTQKLGVQFGALSAEQITSALAPKKSEFLELVDREHLKVILEEQALSQTGIYDETKAIEVGKLVGVNHILAGQVTLVSSRYVHAVPTRKTGHYKTSYLDPKGVKRTRELPFDYMQFQSTNTVVVSISCRLIDVETSKIIDQQSYSSTKSDAATWVVCDKERVNDLPGGDRNLLNGRKVTKSEDVLINEAIQQLGQQTAGQVWQKAQSLRNQ